MSIITRIIHNLLRRPAPTDEQITIAVKNKIISGGGHVGVNFDMISSSIDLGEPYLISIGDNVTLTGVKILTHDASLKKQIGYSKVGEVKIGDNVFIGWGSVVLMNTHIGNNVVIGAGSIVSHDIPDNSVAVGNPCRVISSYDDYLKRMKEKMAECPVIEAIPSDINDLDTKNKLIQSGYGFVL